MSSDGFLIRTKCVAQQNVKKTKGKTKGTNLDLDDLHRPLGNMIRVVQGELVVFGDDFQFESVAFLSIVAPEVVRVVVQTVLVRFEGEPSGVASSNALQGQGSSIEQTFVLQGIFPHGGKGAHSVLEAWDHSLINVHPDNRKLVGVEGADCVAGWEVSQFGSVKNHGFPLFGFWLLLEGSFWGDGKLLKNVSLRNHLSHSLVLLEDLYTS